MSMTQFGSISSATDLKIYNKNIDLILSNLPYKVNRHQCVVLNNEIHLLGGNDGFYNTHYKWNGSSWEQVSTLPYRVEHHQCIVYNNEIHLLGGYNGKSIDIHYKWNGSSWEQVSTLPYNCDSQQCVVLNNELHLLGGVNSGTYYDYHYKWNGSEWEQVSTLPYKVAAHQCVVLDNEIHLLGGFNNINNNGNTYYDTHYKWNGSEWEQVSTLPYKVAAHQCVVLNNEIHLLGGYYYDSSTKTNTYLDTHYKWNGSSWVSVSTLPYKVTDHQCVVLNNEIHLLGGYYYDSSIYYLDTHSIYSFTNNKWITSGELINKKLLLPKNSIIVCDSNDIKFIKGNNLSSISPTRLKTNSEQVIIISKNISYTIL